MAVAEALARGLPVVSTATGAIRRSRRRRRRHRRSARGDCRRSPRRLSRVLGDAGPPRAARGGRAARARSAADLGRRGRGDGARARLDARARSCVAGSAPTGWRCASPRITPRDRRPHARAIADALPTIRRLASSILRPGTGSNLRYLLAEHLRGGDTGCSSITIRRCSRGCRRRQASRRDAWICRRSTIAAIFEGRSLVTASALLDLVSEAWLRALAARCAESGAAALFALSYDGRIVCSPGRSRRRRDRRAREPASADRQGVRAGAGPGCDRRRGALLRGRRLPRAARGQRLGADAGRRASCSVS